MELRSILEKIKLEKGKDNLLSLTLTILKTEEMFVEKHANTEVIIAGFRAILMDAFTYIKENKIEINNEISDLDLDFWKNNVTLFRSKNPDMSTDVYLYSIRNSLRYLLETKKEKSLQKAHIFEIVIKSFLFIDFKNLSIDSVLKTPGVVSFEPESETEVKEIKENKKEETKKIAEN